MPERMVVVFENVKVVAYGRPTGTLVLSQAVAISLGLASRWPRSIRWQCAGAVRFHIRDFLIVRRADPD